MMTNGVVLPEPDYIETDPAVILRELVVEWEKLTGKPLYPAQAEQLFVNNRAYREALLRQQVQCAAKQNLVRFAEEPILDYLGELVDTPRLPAQPAMVRMRLFMPAPVERDLVVPAGLVIGSDDGQVDFATDVDVTIAAGQSSVDANATCQTMGLAGNDYRAGRILALSGDYPEDLAATNIDTTMGGAEREASDPYRERILSAPAGFSVAGPREAYEHFARGAHQDICAVWATSPNPCEIDVYVLTVNGAPSQAMRDLVLASVNGERRRPLSDLVRVPPVRQVDYAIDAQLTLLRGADPDLTAQAAISAIHLWLHGRPATPEREHVLGRERMLGADIVPYQIKTAIKVPGVYDIDLRSVPVIQKISGDSWAHCTAVRISVAGVADG